MKLGPAEYITNRQHGTIITCIKQLHSLYRLGGFVLLVIYSDKEFNPMMADLADMKIILNPASDGENVGDIERFIRTTKEQT